MEAFAKEYQEALGSVFSYLDDSVSSDIKGGVQAGIATCWYRPEGAVNNSAYRPDYEISKLQALFDILGVL